MIGADDWCVNYDKEKRMCGIYDTRPEFCVVDPRKFKKMYGVEEEDLNVSPFLFLAFMKRDMMNKLIFYMLLDYINFYFSYFFILLTLFY